MTKLMAKGKDRLFVCSIYLSGPYMGMLHFFSISSESVINIYISSDDMWLPYNFSLSGMLAMMIIDKTKLYPLKSGLPQNWHLSSLFLCYHHNCLKRLFFYAHHREWDMIMFWAFEYDRTIWDHQNSFFVRFDGCQWYQWPWGLKILEIVQESDTVLVPTKPQTFPSGSCSGLYRAPRGRVWHTKCTYGMSCAQKKGSKLAWES